MSIDTFLHRLKTSVPFNTQGNTNFRKKGKHMADTIEWLEIIGKSAILRRAATEELAHTLTQTDASDALKAAIMSGDRSPLSAELGHNPMKVDHSSNGTGHEEEPDHDDENAPAQPPKPDQDKPSHNR